jgi:hypothetical protein
MNLPEQDGSGYAYFPIHQARGDWHGAGEVAEEVLRLSGAGVFGATSARAHAAPAS